MSGAAGLRADLKALLVARLRLRDVDPASIDDDASLVGGTLGLDSIDMLELALAVEERYGVKITDEQLAQTAFRSIAALAVFVAAEGGAPKAGAPMAGAPADPSPAGHGPAGEEPAA
jgi:acyl carrier protein